jgi:outer membrane protein assembly factor BamB
VGASYVPSPILAGSYLFVVADNGALSCIQAKTGERVWRDRLPGDHNPSPIVANGLIYFISNTGILSVVKPGPQLEIVAQSQVGEPVSASPAVYGGQLFIRGDSHLYCIGAK